MDNPLGWRKRPLPDVRSSCIVPASYRRCSTGQPPYSWPRRWWCAKPIPPQSPASPHAETHPAPCFEANGNRPHPGSVSTRWHPADALNDIRQSTDMNSELGPKRRAGKLTAIAMFIFLRLRLDQVPGQVKAVVSKEVELDTQAVM